MGESASKPVRGGLASVVVTVLLGLTGCSTGDTVAKPKSDPSTPATPTITIKGDLYLLDPRGFATMRNGHSWCEGSGGFADLYFGQQVTITNAQHEKVAIGELGEGRLSRSEEVCWFRFKVPEMPDVPGVFTLRIANRAGAQDFTVSQYKKRRPIFRLLVGDIPGVEVPGLDAP